jgi:alpha-2-macroglobulin
MRLRNYSTVTAIYLAIISAVFSLALLRPHAQGNEAAPAAEASPSPQAPAKPSFSLSTNRTFGTNDRPRVWVNYQGITSLDFRVYRVKDPVKFFKQLNDPHQMGVEERQEVAATYQSSGDKPSLIERLHSFKLSVTGAFKSYFRKQLNHESRVTFNTKFRGAGGEGDRAYYDPANVAQYANVPLLNRDQVEIAFRQQLQPLENAWDSRMIVLPNRGAGVYLVEAVNGDLRAYTVAVVSDLTTVQKTTPDGEMLVYAADRRTGEPRGGMYIEVVKGRKQIVAGTTDAGGVLRVKVPKLDQTPEGDEPAEDEGDMTEGDAGSNDYLVMAVKDHQFAISDLYSYTFEGGGEGNLTSYIYTDRPVYRPAQKVYFKGILRKLGANGYEVPGRTATVTVTDPNDGKLLEKELPLSARGTFSGEVEVAAGAPLGNYGVKARVGDAEVSHYFEVQEYKKPEYKVSVTTPKKFVGVGEKTSFTVEAKYFFGAPVTNAEVKWYVYRSRYYHPWWRSSDDADDFISEGEEEGGEYYGYGSDIVKEGEAKLDAQGRVQIDFEVPPPDAKDSADHTYRLEAMVTDSSRREIEGKASFVGTRGNVVAFATADRYVYNVGDTAKIRVRTSDYEGKPVAAKVTLKFVERKYERVETGSTDKSSRYEYKLRETELGSADVQTSGQGEAEYSYAVKNAGSISIDTVVHDGGKQIVSHGGSLWVSGGKEAWADYAYADDEAVKLVADKKSYQPGETAKVLAMLPTDGAHLLVTTEREGISSVRQMKAAGRSVMIEVPIDATHAPNVWLSVLYLKDGELYSKDKLIAVPARDKFLNVEIIPNKKEYKPRETASYTVLTRNADGSPAAGAEVSVGVVDEAVYSIRPENVGDIRREFYGRRYNRVSTTFSTQYTFSGYSGDKPLQIAKNKRAYQLADFKNDGQYAEPTIRKEFKDTAFWTPDAVTGADGKATIAVQLPDNLTTWRATARAVTADTRVGSSVGKVIARKDLILRLETPRFLAEGDTVTLSGIVHNYLDAPKSTKIEIQVTGAQLLDAPSQTVTIQKQGEHRVDWRVSAPQVGQIKLLAKALTDAESDAIELPLEVIPAGLKQTRGAALALGQDEEEKTYNLDLPVNSHALARTLRLEASPSVVGPLFGALDYLTSYPYGCVEQTMSSFLPNIIVAQVLQQVKSSTLRADNKLGAKVQRGLDRLYGFQHEDGGWGWWKDDKTDPFMTAYVIDGFVQARGAGYAIENRRLERGRAKLKEMIETSKLAEDGSPIDPESRAYMIYALSASGEADAKYLNDLFARRGDLQPYGRALLALALHARNDARARQVAVEIERTAKASDFDAHWESTRRPMLDFSEDNDLEATALSVKALSRLLSSSPVLPKAARWLVANRSNGYFWQSTKHTAFAVYGLTDYLKVSQELQPDYTVEVYLNGEQVHSQRVTSADTAPFKLERKGGGVSGSNQLRVVKRGKGVLYFASTLDYYTQGDVAAQGSNGLRLTREYLRLRVTESNGESKWTVEPLAGELRSGDLIVSKLRLQGAKARQILVEDPIPAGCEQVENVSGINLNYSDGKWSDWYSAREFRDNRTAIFLDYFDGDGTFQYAMRVQIPGEFKVGPARSELMYQPQVQANTAGARQRILDKR